jgi:phage shock protein E
MSLLARFRSRERSHDGNNAESRVDIHPVEFLQRRTPDDPVLDVRTAQEFEMERLEGARNLDILEDRFLERLEELDLDPDEPVYLYCRSGNRSGHAARILRQHGYRRAFNVGGLDDLVREGAPTAS